MHVLANDDDDGSNDASDLVEERSSLAQPMNSHEEAVSIGEKKDLPLKPILEHPKFLQNLVMCQNKRSKKESDVIFGFRMMNYIYLKFIVFFA